MIPGITVTSGANSATTRRTTKPVLQRDRTHPWSKGASVTTALLNRTRNAGGCRGQRDTQPPHCPRCRCDTGVHCTAAPLRVTNKDDDDETHQTGSSDHAHGAGPEPEAASPAPSPREVGMRGRGAAAARGDPARLSGGTRCRRSNSRCLRGGGCAETGSPEPRAGLAGAGRSGEGTRGARPRGSRALRAAAAEREPGAWRRAWTSTCGGSSRSW